MVWASSRIPRGSGTPSKRTHGGSGGAGVASTPLGKLSSVFVMRRSFLVCRGDRQGVASAPRRGVVLIRPRCGYWLLREDSARSPRVDADRRLVQLHYGFGA